MNDSTFLLTTIGTPGIESSTVGSAPALRHMLPSAAPAMKPGSSKRLL